MPAYPFLSEIEMEWRTTGKGLCIIVEGETYTDDPWFYNHWFGDQAQRFSFFPQDGWPRVEAAVGELRRSLGLKKVYGLIDRDFADLPPAGTVPVNGILRTPKYTLENYLLDPNAWCSYFSRFKRNPERRKGWETVEAATAMLEAYYRQCILLSAHNWIAREARKIHNATNPDALPETPAYFDHPKALENLNISDHFKHYSVQTGVNIDDLYKERIKVLQTMLPAELEAVVSGKYVLKLLKEACFNDIPNARWEDVLGEVADYSLPPEDIKALLDAIWRDSI